MTKKLKFETIIYAALFTLLFAAMVTIFASHTRTLTTPSVGVMQWSSDSVSWGGWDLR